MATKDLKKQSMKRIFIIMFIVDLSIVWLIGSMDFPRADYSDIDPLLVLIHEILALMFLAVFGFVFMIFGVWIVIRNGYNKVLEMETKKD